MHFFLRTSWTSCPHGIYRLAVERNSNQMTFGEVKLQNDKHQGESTSPGCWWAREQPERALQLTPHVTSGKPPSGSGQGWCFEKIGDAAKPGKKVQVFLLLATILSPSYPNKQRSNKPMKSTSLMPLQRAHFSMSFLPNPIFPVMSLVVCSLATASSFAL